MGLGFDGLAAREELGLEWNGMGLGLGNITAGSLCKRKKCRSGIITSTHFIDTPCTSGR